MPASSHPAFEQMITLQHAQGATEPPHQEQLCVATFGDRHRPAVVLPGPSGLYWEDDFCQRLADAGRFVLRYDIRDTGRSTSYPTGSPGYTLRDLATDVVGLLDTFEIPRAHLVGFSVAGWICQLTAIDHADRVSALTLINTRPTAPGPPDPDLPDHSPAFMARFTEEPDPDWSDRQAVIDYGVRDARASSGSHGFDEAAARQRVTHIVDRTESMASSTMNLAFVDAGPRWRERLSSITAPTVVIHGTDDPFVPYGNGEAMAREILGAELVPLPGIGHELPPVTWERVLAAITAPTPHG